MSALSAHVPEEVTGGAPAPEGGAAPSQATALMSRRPGRLTLRRLDLRSVARVSIAFYLAFVGLLGVTAAVFWMVASVTGLIRRVEHLIQSLFGFSSFHFQPLRIVLWGTVIGAAVAIVGTGLNVLAALAYNLVAARRGGVKVTLTDDDGFPAWPSGPSGAGSPGRMRPLI